MNILSSIRRPIIQIPILILIFSFVYFGPISLIFRNPFSYHFSHGLLILGISGYMVWRKKGELRLVRIRPNLFAGSLIIIISNLVLLCGKFTNTPLLEGISLVIGILGFVLLLFGFCVAKIVIIPIFFLLFMFPIFDKILGSYSNFLQLIAAFIGSVSLQIIGFPVLHYGEIIELPHITLKVGQACSGINHIIALIILSIFLGYVIKMKWFTKVIFVFMGFLVGIFANGVRVALIGIWTKYFGTESFHGPFDIFYSSFIFFIGFVIIIFAPFILTRRNRKKAIMERIKNENNFEDRIDMDNQLSTNNSRLPFLILIVLLCLTWTYKIVARPLPSNLNTNIDEFPMIVDGWVGQNVEKLGETYELGNFDVKLKRIYYDQSGNQIKLFVGYLASQKQDNRIDNYTHEIIQNNSSWVKIKLNSSDSWQINSGIRQNKDILQHVYFWYNINGRVVGNRYGAILATIIDAFLKRRTNAAIIILSRDIKEVNRIGENEKVTMQFIRTILPLTQKFLNNAHKDAV